MRNRWASHGAIVLTCVTLLAGCGGDDGANDERRVQRTAATPQGGQAAALVSLSGCIEAAPGNNQFRLRNVRFEPRRGDPHATTTTPGGHGITEGAFVRLDRGEQDLNAFLGQRVQLTGSVTDDGRNTIGTAGTAGQPQPSGDRSQAAGSGDHEDRKAQEMGRIARESMANGTAAEVRVQQIQSTGERCQPAQRP